MRLLQLSCDLQTLNLALIYCHINLNFVHINILCLSQVIFQDFLLKDQFPVPVIVVQPASSTTRSCPVLQHMHESPSSTSTGSANSKFPAADHTIQPRWQFSAPHHRFRPSHSFSSWPTRNPRAFLPVPFASSEQSLSPSPTAEPVVPSKPLHPPRTLTCYTTRATRRGSPTRVGAPIRLAQATIQCSTSGRSATPPICLRVPRRSRSLPRSRRQGDPISEHTQRRRYLHRRALAPRVGGAPHARRLSLFR